MACGSCRGRLCTCVIVDDEEGTTIVTGPIVGTLLTVSNNIIGHRIATAQNDNSPFDVGTAGTTIYLSFDGIFWSLDPGNPGSVISTDSMPINRTGVWLVGAQVIFDPTTAFSPIWYISKNKNEAILTQRVSVDDTSFVDPVNNAVTAVALTAGDQLSVACDVLSGTENVSCGVLWARWMGEVA